MNYFLFVLVASFWGGSFVAIKYVIAGLPPLFGAGFRIVISLVTLLLIAKVFKKKMRVRPGIRPKLWFSGILAQGLPFALLFWGERHVSAGLAGIINGTVPIWTQILSLFFLRNLDAVSSHQGLGLGIGLVGVSLIFLPIVRFSAGPMEIAGSVAILGMALSYAVSILWSRWLLAGRERVAPYGFLVHQAMASVAFLLVASALFEPWSGVPAAIRTPSVTGAALYLGICSTAIAWIIFSRLIQVWTAVRASVVTYVVPILAILFDYLFFGNLPNRLQLTGVGTVIIGVILIQWPQLFGGRRK